MTTKGMPWITAEPGSATPYLRAPIFSLAGSAGRGTRVLDVGCGNGYWCGEFLARGCSVVGIDPSPSGIEIARETYPEARFECTGAGADLAERLGEGDFDLIVSSEVIEHLYDPPAYAQGCYDALRPGGLLVLTTPYHGRLKDIALAVSGKMERHHDALRVGGHIKFFTEATLKRVLTEAGFENFRFAGAGRYPWMWKSMVVSVQRPG